MTETAQHPTNNMDSVSEKVSGIVEPILIGLGFELVDIDYLSEHGRWVLRMYVDKENGISLDDCAFISKEIGDLIDVKDLIHHKYVLEISSPGLHRPLKKEEHFMRVIGKRVKIRLKHPIGGRRNFTGRLQDLQGEILSLKLDDERLRIDIKEIEKANLVYEFDN